MIGHLNVHVSIIRRVRHDLPPPDQAARGGQRLHPELEHVLSLPARRVLEQVEDLAAGGRRDQGGVHDHTQVLVDLGLVNLLAHQLLRLLSSLGVLLLLLLLLPLLLLLQQLPLPVILLVLSPHLAGPRCPAGAGRPQEQLLLVRQIRLRPRAVSREWRRGGRRSYLK